MLSGGDRGGLDSIVDAIVGGLLIRLLENLAEYVDGQWLNVGNLYNIAPFTFWCI